MLNLKWSLTATLKSFAYLFCALCSNKLDDNTITQRRIYNTSVGNYIFPGSAHVITFYEKKLNMNNIELR